MNVRYVIKINLSCILKCSCGSQYLNKGVSSSYHSFTSKSIPKVFNDSNLLAWLY